MNYKLKREDVKKVIDIIIDNFKKNEATINNLNVFPVPDGDTGTNMLLTLKSIRQELLKSEKYSVKSLAEKISFGALMGARGNSGVILSQILKGLLEVIAKADDFCLDIIREALESSENLAYSSVQDPTEGTMLTTIKDICNFFKDLIIDTPEITSGNLLDNIIKKTEKSVIRTTYLLPVLKEAGVVDAGAQGILDILIGFKKALMEVGKVNVKLERKESVEAEKVSVRSSSENDYLEFNKNNQYNNMDNNTKASSDLKYTYCTEFIVKGKDINIATFRDHVESLGDSAMVVGNNRLVKVHVHTNYPHRVIKRALKEGTLHDIQINNMVDQSREARILEKGKKEEQKIEQKIGLAAVANGSGFEDIFKSLGVDIVIPGGQSMNPSTYDIVKAVEKIGAEKIIVFPNNKNIIATAKQAKRIIKKDFRVIPTRTIPQGIAALLNYNPDLSIEDNIHNMEEAIKKIKSGEVTAAVRDANLLVGEIKKGEYIGLADGKVRVIADDLIKAVIDLAKEMIVGDEEIITFYTGKDVDEEHNDKIKAEIEKYFPELEIEFYKGNQPFYQYIFSIE